MGFKSKRESKFRIERHDDRLPAKFTQKDGIDYKEISSPVFREDLFKILMT